MADNLNDQNNLEIGRETYSKIGSQSQNSFPPNTEINNLHLWGLLYKHATKAFKTREAIYGTEGRMFKSHSD